MALSQPTSSIPLTLSSGAVAHRWEVPSPSGIVILQHGFGEYAARYVSSHFQLIPKLNAAGFSVWGLDLWGHGDSPGTRSIVHLEKAVRDHVELRRLAAEAMPGLPLHLFGHSLGGLVTAGSVGQDGEHIAGVVLTGPVLPNLDAPIRAGANMLATLVPKQQIFSWMQRTGEACRIDEEERKREADEKVFPGHISYLLAATAARVAKMVWDGVGSWSVPTLVCHGTADLSSACSQSRDFVSQLRSKDKRMYEVEGGIHELLNGHDREVVVGVILTWLQERSVKDGAEPV